MEETCQQRGETLNSWEVTGIITIMDWICVCVYVCATVSRSSVSFFRVTKLETTAGETETCLFPSKLEKSTWGWWVLMKPDQTTRLSIDRENVICFYFKARWDFTGKLCFFLQSGLYFCSFIQFQCWYLQRKQQNLKISLCRQEVRLSVKKHHNLCQHILGPEVNAWTVYRRHIKWLLGNEDLQTVKNPNIYPAFKTDGLNKAHRRCQ